MKYVILEIIPSTSKRETGNILQIQALKLNELKLIDRFDYRLDIPLNNPDLLNILSYDKDKFTYVKDEKELLKNFKDFISDLPLLIIDNPYTLDYLKDINNPKESVFKHLNLEYSQDVFDKIINKYNLEPSNHLVDLLYEALIYESNN
ncbi:MAG: hypothetical protein MR266_03110 [Erysipelotrichaceae bacterium]|nr:hypothetical protein [Erysipelotrichaceae bacterium]